MSLVLVLALVQASFASTISGRVVDISGGALAGATVVATCGAERASTVTDQSGRFEIAKLPSASCEVSAALDGFATGRERADLRTTASGTIDFRLAVRKFAQQIVVTPLRGTQRRLEVDAGPVYA